LRPLPRFRAAAKPSAQPTPLARAHAHNDFEHDRPLFDSLDRGFTSVEADVWLVRGKLLVAHELDQVRPGRTLTSLYLRPLWKRVKRNGGSVYEGSPHYFSLWIDVKSEAAPTYRAIDKRLRRHREMFTKFTASGVFDGAVTAIISGNRASELIAKQRVRFAGLDGRLADLGTGAAPELMPVISDDWTAHFSWTGKGPIPPTERGKLHAIVAIAHDNGQRIRFWETPDESGAATAVWKELMDARVDYTDHLAALARFLGDKDSLPSVPYIYWEDCVNCWPEAA
jgi:hypothetical protein